MSKPLNDIRWLAGYLESEGCFTISKIRKKYILFKIKVDSTDRDVATRTSNIMLGYTRLYQTKSKLLLDRGHKRLYCVIISGSLAIQWMMTLYSLMGSRRKARIKEIIFIWESYGKDIKSHP